MSRLPLRLLVLALIPAAAADAHPGHGMVVDSNGAIHFVDLGHGAIWTLAPDGRLRTTAVDKHMHRLVIDAADNLYFDHTEFVGPPVTVGDPPRLEKAGTRVSSFWKLDPSGGLTPIVPPTPTPYPTATQPIVSEFGNGLTLLRDDDDASYGVVYAEDASFPHLVKRTPGTPHGRETTIIPKLFDIREGEHRPPDFGAFQAYVWGANGSILVTERGTVRRITPDGRVTSLGAPLSRDPVVGLGVVWQDSVLGVAEDAAGNVYAADYGRSCVRRIDPAGAVSTVHRAGFGWSPTGVTVDGEDLYILENRVDIISPVLKLFGLRGGLGGPRVLKRTPDGRVTVLATVNGDRGVYALVTILGVVALAALLIRYRVKKRNEPRRAVDLPAHKI